MAAVAQPDPYTAMVSAISARDHKSVLPYYLKLLEQRSHKVDIIHACALKTPKNLTYESLEHFSDRVNADRRYTRTRFVQANRSVRCGDLINLLCDTEGQRWAAYVHAKKTAALNYLVVIEFGDGEDWQRDLKFRCSCPQTLVRYVVVLSLLSLLSSWFSLISLYFVVL